MTLIATFYALYYYALFMTLSVTFYASGKEQIQGGEEQWSSKAVTY
jgi:hypothetical protein